MPISRVVTRYRRCVEGTDASNKTICQWDPTTGWVYHDRHSLGNLALSSCSLRLRFWLENFPEGIELYHIHIASLEHIWFVAAIFVYRRPRISPSHPLPYIPFVSTDSPHSPRPAVPRDQIASVRASLSLNPVFPAIEALRSRMELHEKSMA